MDTQEMIATMQLQSGAKIVSAVILDHIPSAPQPPQTRSRDRNNPQMPAQESPFDSGYHFKNVIGLELKVDDLIVAEVRNTYSICRVVDPDVMVTDIGCPVGALKHVVAQINNGDVARVKAAEQEAYKHLAMSEVNSRLEKFKEQIGGKTFDSIQCLVSNQSDCPEIETIEPPKAPGGADG